MPLVLLAALSLDGAWRTPEADPAALLRLLQGQPAAQHEVAGHATGLLQDALRELGAAQQRRQVRLREHAGWCGVGLVLQHDGPPRSVPPQPATEEEQTHQGGQHHQAQHDAGDPLLQRTGLTQRRSRVGR